MTRTAESRVCSDKFYIIKTKGLSQEELAVKLNVVRQTVSKWEQGYEIIEGGLTDEDVAAYFLIMYYFQYDAEEGTMIIWKNISKNLYSDLHNKNTENSLFP